MDNTPFHQDSILLEGMTFYAYHGVNPEERVLGQRFVVDLEAYLDLAVPAGSDSLEDTVNYAALYNTARAIVEGEPYNLIEAVAEAVAQAVLASYPVSAVRVRVKKPSAPIKGAVLSSVAAEVFRQQGA
jgi:dihydroneopterin aldolase